jgi:hypothetical protein
MIGRKVLKGEAGWAWTAGRLTPTPMATSSPTATRTGAKSKTFFMIG